MLVTSAAAIVPLPFAIVHTCAGFVGCVRTVTAYCAPVLTGSVKENLPFDESVRSAPPLSCSTKPVPARPASVPPTSKLSCTVDAGGGVVGGGCVDDGADGSLRLPLPFEQPTSSSASVKHITPRARLVMAIVPTFPSLRRSCLR